MGYAEAQYTADEVINAMKQMGANESGIPPVKPWVTVVPADQSVKIYWRVKNTDIEKQRVCTVKGVMIRKKLGSPITGLDDGELVGIYEDAEAWAHEDNPITITNLQNGVWIWVAVWAFSDHNVYNLDMSNVFQVQPGVDLIYGFHQDFTDLNPQTSITYIGANAQFTPMYTRAGRNGITSWSAPINLGGVELPHTYSTPELRSEFTMGSWKQWSWLNKNQPFFLIRKTEQTSSSSGGVTAYTYKYTVQKYARLEASNYNVDADTKQLLDLSNIPDGFYPMGYFAWIPLIYMKEVYDADGNGRTVYFSETKNTSATSDFVAVGFKNKKGQQLKGLWLAMNYQSIENQGTASNTKYYGFSNPEYCTIAYPPEIGKYAPNDSNGQNLIINAGPLTSNEIRYSPSKLPAQTMTVLKTKLSQAFYTDDFRVFGGEIANVLRDILILLYKTTDIQEASGYGGSVFLGSPATLRSGNNSQSMHIEVRYSSMFNYTASFQTTYLALFPNKSGLYIEWPKYDYDNVNLARDVFMNYGGFYGIDGTTFYQIYGSGSSTKQASFAAMGAGKLFHSFALGSYLYPLIDLNMVIKSNRVYYTKNYKYDLLNILSSYDPTNVYYPETRSLKFPKKMVKVSSSIGSIPDQESTSSGSGSTGLCDASIPGKGGIYETTPTNPAESVPLIWTLASQYSNIMNNNQLSGYESYNASCGEFTGLYASYSGPMCLSNVMDLAEGTTDSPTNLSNSGVSGIPGFAYVLMPFPPTNYTPYDDYEGGVPSQW